MGIYVNNNLAYKVNGSSLHTNLALNPGNYNTVVQEWDNCGGSTTASVPIVVSSGSTQNGVTVTAPLGGSTVQSPIQFTASAGTTSCATGIAAMGIYVANVLKYKVNGSTLSTQLALAAGPQQATIQPGISVVKRLRHLLVSVSLRQHSPSLLPCLPRRFLKKRRCPSM